MPSVKKNIFIEFPCILIALLPFFLITGPFLSDLSVVLVSLFFLYNTIKEKDFFFYKNLFFKIFFIFFLFLVLNSFIKFYNLDNIRISVGYIRFGLFSLALYYFLKKKNTLLRWLFFSFLFCFCLLIIDGYIQYIFGTNLIGFEIQDGGKRVSSFFHEELILGSYLSRLFPIFFGISIFLFKKNYKVITLLSIIYILTEVLIFLSGERTAFFLNTLSAVYIIFMIKNFKKIRFFSFLISIFIIILISLFNSKAKERIWDATINQVGINSSQKHVFSEIHESHYISAYKMFIDNKILGVGVRNFRNFCNLDRYKVSERSCTTHPHNTYVQILSELGLIGFGFLMFAFLKLCSISLYHFKEQILKKKFIYNNLQICLLSSILITLWPVVPSGNFFNNWLSIIYFFPIGILLWSFDPKPNYEK